MEKNEMDDLFSQLNDFLSGDEKPETGGEFDLNITHDDDGTDEPDVNKTDIFEEKIQPLIEEICQFCSENQIPAQFSVKVSKSLYCSVSVCTHLSLQVRAAALLYTLPHPVFHLVRYAVRNPHFVMVPEEDFNREKESEDLHPMLKELIQAAQDNKIPLQWGVVIRRKNAPEPDNFHEAMDRMMKMIMTDGESEMGCQEILFGLHMEENEHACAMISANNFYKVGSALAWEIVALHEELHEEDQPAV